MALHFFCFFSFFGLLGGALETYSIANSRWIEEMVEVFVPKHAGLWSNEIMGGCKLGFKEVGWLKFQDDMLKLIIQD